MNKEVKLIPFILFLCVFTSCNVNPTARISINSTETITSIRSKTITITPTEIAKPEPTVTEINTELPTDIPTATNTINTPLIPLYPEISWDDLGPSNRNIVLYDPNQREIPLSGNAYQATLPKEKNALTNNIRQYYLPGNLLAMDWKVVSGFLGPQGTVDQYYNEAGYFLEVAFHSCANMESTPCVIVWMSEATTIVPPLTPQPSST